MNSSATIVTQVYNQNRDLVHFIRGLKKSGFKDELVIVAIGGEDPFEVVEEELPFEAKLIYMEKENSILPVAQAKNIGSSMAQGDILVFLDPNQIPSKELLLSYLTALNQDPEAIHAGRVIGLGKRPHKNWSHRFLAKNCAIGADSSLSRGAHGRELQSAEEFRGSNFALLKQVYESLNGFDEDYKGESANMDFYYKALHRGLGVKYNHFALAYELGSSSAARNKIKIDLDSVIDNSSIFFSKWGHFPSKRDLKAFQRRGLLRIDEKLGVIERAN